jgi:hypothetical protein
LSPGSTRVWPCTTRRDTKPEEAEHGLCGRSGHLVAGEAAAEHGERVLEGLHRLRGRGVVRPPDLKGDEAVGARTAEGGIGHALGVDVPQGPEALVEQGGPRPRVPGAQHGRDVLGGGVVGSRGIEGAGDPRQLRLEAQESRGSVAGLGAFELRELGEEEPGRRLKTTQRLRVEAVDGRHPVAVLLAGGPGLFRALVAEGGLRHHAGGGRLVQPQGGV